jgi:hypothetical protein
MKLNSFLNLLNEQVGYVSKLFHEFAFMVVRIGEEPDVLPFDAFRGEEEKSNK